MASLRRTLPSLDHLEVFEAAGRLRSFSRAGAELGISQAAVSYAIRMLETDLGARLFQRSSTGATLTEAGDRMHAGVALALAQVRQSVAETRRGAATPHVTLSVSLAFATLWMLPRIAALRADLPDVDLRLQSTDRDVDLRAENLELGVRYGGGVLPHYSRAPIAPEVISAVCSPAYLAGLDAPPRTAADLRDCALIHLDEPHRPCPNWADWFAAAGAPHDDRSEGLHLNDYTLCVLSAIEGHGFVLGWEHLVGRLVASGALARPTPERWRTGIDFMVVWVGEPSPAAARVRDWLIAEGAATITPPASGRSDPA